MSYLCLSISFVKFFLRGFQLWYVCWLSAMTYHDEVNQFSCNADFSMNGEIPSMPITTLAGVSSLTACESPCHSPHHSQLNTLFPVLPELPLPTPLPHTVVNKSLLFTQRIAEEARRLTSSPPSDALVGELVQALRQTNTDHMYASMIWFNFFLNLVSVLVSWKTIWPVVPLKAKCPNCWKLYLRRTLVYSGAECNTMPHQMQTTSVSCQPANAFTS
jgi:hypothetical protein